MPPQASRGDLAWPIPRSAARRAPHAPGQRGPVEILRGVTLDVAPGESVGLVGPSGSGKSSLLMLMGGLEQATGGEVRAWARTCPPWTRTPSPASARQHGGGVPEFPPHPHHDRARERGDPLELAGHRDAFARAAAQLEAVGLGPRADHYPAQMSGASSSAWPWPAPSPPSPASSRRRAHRQPRRGQRPGHRGPPLRPGRRTGATLVLVTHDEGLGQPLRPRDPPARRPPRRGRDGEGRRMSVALRLAARELRGSFRNGLRGFWIFLLCLALGVGAIAAVGTVRTASSGGLEREGAASSAATPRPSSPTASRARRSAPGSTAPPTGFPRSWTSAPSRSPTPRAPPTAPLPRSAPWTTPTPSWAPWSWTRPYPSRRPSPATAPVPAS
jgi:putative ABC transport system ATP-binding protein